MKRRIAWILAAVMMLLCVAGCAAAPETTQPDAPKESYSFTYNGTKIALHADMAAVLAGLGEPLTYTESTSCAFDGLDKVYGYASFNIETYPKDGKDYISGWYFKDDMVKNDEGIAVGSAQADVEKAYGTEGFNGTNSYVMRKGDGTLTIIIKDGFVSSVQYAATFDE